MNRNIKLTLFALFILFFELAQAIDGLNLSSNSTSTSNTDKIYSYEDYFEIDTDKCIKALDAVHALGNIPDSKIICENDNKYYKYLSQELKGDECTDNDVNIYLKVANNTFNYLCVKDEEGNYCKEDEDMLNAEEDVLIEKFENFCTKSDICSKAKLEKYRNNNMLVRHPMEIVILDPKNMEHYFVAVAQPNSQNVLKTLECQGTVNELVLFNLTSAGQPTLNLHQPLSLLTYLTTVVLTLFTFYFLI